MKFEQCHRNSVSWLFFLHLVSQNTLPVTNISEIFYPDFFKKNIYKFDKLHYFQRENSTKV